MPQPGFNGVMSIYEAKWFSLFGHEVELLLPFDDQEAFDKLRRQHKLDDLDALDRFGGSFAIRPVFAGADDFGSYDVLIYQSYFPDDWTRFAKACRASATIFTKNFPKFVTGRGYRSESSVVGQFATFDLIACALREDVLELQADRAFHAAHRHQIAFVPRGADDLLLHPARKIGAAPAIGLDVPVGDDFRSVEHYVAAISILRERVPGLRVLTLGRQLPGLESEVVPFGRFDRIYDRFFNEIWAYLVINYAYSPAHIQATVQKLHPGGWQARAIYEVQNVEAQMSGAAVVGHASNLIPELFVPGVSGFTYPDFADTGDIADRIQTILSDFPAVSRGARAWAMGRYRWEDCIRLWETALLDRLDADRPKAAIAAPAVAAAEEPLPAMADAGPSGILAPELAPEIRDQADTLVRLAKKFMWDAGEVRRYVERCGVTFAPTGPHYEIPTLDEIERSFEYDTDPPKPLFDSPSVFDPGVMQSFLESLLPFAAEFDPPRKANGAGSFHWENNQFSYSDAAAYYCVVRRQQPETIVEIGSGFSTLAAAAAIRANGKGQIICIDPNPRPEVTGVEGVRLIREPVQRVPPRFFEDTLGDGDLLFIDSTHTVKTGSDCVFIYLKLLPELRRRLLVHSHDVRLPFPRNPKALTEAKLYWGEQYLLYALLLNNPMFQVVYGSDYFSRLDRKRLEKLMHGRFPAGGVSLWYWKLE